MNAELVIPRGITRYDYGRTRGWLARVYRTEERPGGEKQQSCARKLFSDGVHGSDAAALDAAIDWQQSQPPASREKKRTAGYGYIRKATRRYRVPTGELTSYEAFEAWFWDADERPCSTSWSIDTHGEDVAYERCEEWLERMRAGLASEPLAQAG